MKKILSNLLIITVLLQMLSIRAYSEDDSGYFIVTAYYSPLPNQEAYLTGDYNSELRLNGNGTHGASGKEVFSGMLAAPKNYSFGTKIYLDGLGIGEVSDRGGAIVNAGKRGYEHDRIDVWMGYGDEGLKRALNWGKRKVKGYVTDTSLNTTLDYKKIAAPDWATNGLKKISNIFTIGLGKGSDIGLIRKLQNLFTEVGLYDGEVDGVYNNKVIDIVYNYQIDNGIVDGPTTYGAGYWGKNTRELFLKEYLNGDFDKKIETETKIIEKNINNTSNIETITENKVAEPINKTEIFDGAVTEKDDIIKLQNILRELSLYKGEPTGVYKDIVDTIYDYQISKGIVSGLSSPGAGNFGPMTRASLKKTYEEHIAKLEQEQKEKARIEAEKQREIERQKELEEKYKKLEELSAKKAEEKIASIGIPKFGEVSVGVRTLQVTLKELGYFEYKDTAIFGDMTKESIFSYQLSKKLVSKKDDLGAGMIGPRTLDTIKNDLKQKYLNELAKNEGVNTEEIAAIVGNKM